MMKQALPVQKPENHPVLVLIPGLLSDTRVWQPLADRLSTEFTVHHAALTRGTSITAMAQTMLDETTKATQGMIVVGHSMGGRIALEMARLAPGRIKGLVLSNTGHGPRREGEEAKRLQVIALGHESMEQLADQWIAPMVDAARLADRKLMDGLRDMVLQCDASLHERHIRALMARPDAGAYLSEITCPILLLTGRQDNWSPVAQHEKIARATPDSQLVIIENAGHFAPFERPTKVVEVIGDWINEKFLLPCV